MLHIWIRICVYNAMFIVQRDAFVLKLQACKSLWWWEGSYIMQQQQLQLIINITQPAVLRFLKQGLEILIFPLVMSVTSYLCSRPFPPSPPSGSSCKASLRQRLCLRRFCLTWQPVIITSFQSLQLSNLIVSSTSWLRLIPGSWSHSSGLAPPPGPRTWRTPCSASAGSSQVCTAQRGSYRF